VNSEKLVSYFKAAVQAIVGSSASINDENNLSFSNVVIYRVGDNVFIDLKKPWSGNFNVLDFARKLREYMKANMDSEVWTHVAGVMFIHEIDVLGAVDKKAVEAQESEVPVVAVDMNEYVDMGDNSGEEKAVEDVEENKPAEKGDEEL